MPRRLDERNSRFLAFKRFWVYMLETEQHVQEAVLREQPDLFSADLKRDFQTRVPEALFMGRFFFATAHALGFFRAHTKKEIKEVDRLARFSLASLVLGHEGADRVDDYAAVLKEGEQRLAEDVRTAIAAGSIVIDQVEAYICAQLVEACGFVPDTEQAQLIVSEMCRMVETDRTVLDEILAGNEISGPQ